MYGSEVNTSVTGNFLCFGFLKLWRVLECDIQHPRVAHSSEGLYSAPFLYSTRVSQSSLRVL